MKLIRTVSLVCLLCVFSLASFAQNSDEQVLKTLDASWEKAQLELDLASVKNLLAEDFIWVHNHAGTVDSKADVIARIERYIREDNRSTRARTNKDVEVILQGETAVVHGFTTVDLGPSPITYHFMRTYVKLDGKFYLLANQTMAIPSPNED